MKVLVDAHKGGMMQEAALISMVKNIADVLEKHYPGHAWAVGPSNDYSMLAIWNEALSMRYGMWVRVNDWSSFNIIWLLSRLFFSNRFWTIRS